MKLVKLIAVLLVLPLIVKLFAVTQASSSPSNARLASTVALSKEANQPADNWEYIEKRDEVSGRIHRSAIDMSINTVGLKSPYGGAQYGKISVTNYGVLFSIEKGQISCGERCDILVKFDNDEPTSVSAQKFGDGSTSIQFTDSSILDELKKSRSLKIQVDVFQNGFQEFTFDVSGFKQPPLPYTSTYSTNTTPTNGRL